MIALGRALCAEILKMKRTLALWLALAAPVAIVLLNLARYLQRPLSTLPQSGDPWVAFMGDLMVFWALLMLPLAITVETSLLGALEHGNRMWKQLFALPAPRWTVYAAKQLCAWGLTGLSSALYFAGTILVGLALRTLRPETRLAAPIPWTTLAISVLLAYLGTWLISALQLWVSTHWPSFVLAMGVGIVATVAGIMLIQSDWGRWYPWTMAGTAAVTYLRHELILAPVIVAVLGGILLSVGGAWEVTRRDVP
jgi:lantibiotic transport system permease protein